MRKLQKSYLFPGSLTWRKYLRPQSGNTSTKPYARFRHSLSSLTFGDNEPLQAPRRGFSLPPAPPTHAERRASLQPYFPNCAQRRAQSRAMKFSKPWPPIVEPAAVPEAVRKMTGAVRRGLERGKSA